jgi:hypothetical protein
MTAAKIFIVEFTEVRAMVPNGFENRRSEIWVQDSISCISAVYIVE